MTTLPVMRYADWLNLHAYLLWCYDGLTTLERSVSEHYVNNSAWLVRKGWARVEYGDSVLVAHPGEWLIVKPGRRRQEFAAGTHLLSIAFDAHWPDGMRWLDEGLPLKYRADECPELEKRAISMVRCARRVGSDHWDIRQDAIDAMDYLDLEGHLIRWLSALLPILKERGVVPSGMTGLDDRVSKAVRLLNGHDLGEPLELSELSAQVGLSAVHLVRLFRRHLDETPKSYFTKLRLEYAKDNLRLPGLRASDVSASLGFSDVANFSNWFKKQIGQSPRQYSRTT